MAYGSIIKPQDYFNTKVWTGTGSSNAITGVGFQPDFCWVKSRSLSENHFLNNGIQGSTKVLQSDTTAAEQTSSNGMTSFDTDGFTVNTDTGFNGSGSTYIGWSWKAANTSGTSNTDGSITSTVSVNATSKFSIVKYTGYGSASTVGHGLGVVPQTMFIKKTSGSESWGVYHSAIGNTHFLQLNTNGGDSSGSGFWNNTTPTSSVFTVNSDGGVNASGETYIAYCFGNVPGFSVFSEFIGNGNGTNGTFVPTGFKPAFVLIKCSSHSGDWMMTDAALTSAPNPCTQLVEANTTDTEDNWGSSSAGLDLNANGFTLKTTNSGGNADTRKYLYWAFATNPFVANVGGGLPATAGRGL